MSTPQKCVACGYVGYDVGPRLVRLTDPAEPFGVQVRCVDSEGCADRRVVCRCGGKDNRHTKDCDR